MFYSGLFFLGVFPIPPMRFWDGGLTATLTAGVLDIIGGLGMFVLVGLSLVRGYFGAKADPATLRRYLNFMALASILGLVGDLIGGLYAISAQIGLYTTIIDWMTLRKK